MSSNSSIYYFLIANQQTEKEIGTYTDNSDTENTISDFNTIVAKSKEILRSSEPLQNKTRRNRLCLENHNIYYIVEPSNTFYLAAIRKNSTYATQENLIFELIEDIEHQGIRKLVDKNGELTIVGRQNLKFSIEKYQESSKNKITSPTVSGIFDSSFTVNEPPSKISQVNSQINEVKDEMKQSVQNLIGNVNEMQDLDDKSSKIKDASVKFQQDAVILVKKARWEKNKTRIIIALLVAAVLGAVLYFIFE